MRDIAYDLIPEQCTEREYDTDYTYFHVSQRHSHPRYVCYDCHGRASWFDPFDDVCTVVDVRVDLDWGFVRHPTLYYVGPRFWYWRRYDCPAFYVSIPQFWCSLYPRHLFFDHFHFGLHRVGVWYEKRGYGHPPARYHGRPGLWDRSYKGRYPDRPGYGKPPRHDVTHKGGEAFDAKRLYARGKTPPGKLAEVRKPQRLSKPGTEKGRAGTSSKGGLSRGKPEGRVGTKAVKGKETTPSERKGKLSRRGQGEEGKRGVKALKGNPGDRRTPKGEVLKGKPAPESKGKVTRPGEGERKTVARKVTKQKSSTKSKGKTDLGKRGDKGGSKTEAKAARKKGDGGKAKVNRQEKAGGDRVKSKAKAVRKTADRGKSKAKAGGGAKGGSKSKAKADVKKSSKSKRSGEKSRNKTKSARKQR
jgi:hypothetical protein